MHTIHKIDPTTSAEPRYRKRYCVYDTREEALADGWPDAEYGSWQTDPASPVLVAGWIALDYEPDES